MCIGPVAKSEVNNYRPAWINMDVQLPSGKKGE